MVLSALFERRSFNYIGLRMLISHLFLLALMMFSLFKQFLFCLHLRFSMSSGRCDVGSSREMPC